MKKTITTSLAATMVLCAAMAPTAMAASKNQPQMLKSAIVLNGKQVSSPMHIVSKDPNTKQATSYLPLWYIFQALKAAGVTYTWDGKTLNIHPASGMTVDTTNLKPGHGPILLEIDGTVIDTASRITAPDPASHVATTYLPLYYMKYVLSRMGIQSKWDGTTWTMTMQMVDHLDISGDQTVAQGQPDELTLTATYSDGKTIALPPGRATWSTSDNNDAFITPTQSFLATKPGTYTLTAKFGGISQTYQVNVFGPTASVQLVPNGALVANGKSTQTITVNAVDANGAPALNENGSVVISSNDPWLVTGANDGNPVLGSSVTVPLKNGVGTLQVQSPTTPGLSLTLNAANLSDATSGVNITYGSATVTSVPQKATALLVTPVNNRQYLIANQSGNTAGFNVSVVDQAGAPMLTGSYAYTVSVSGSADFTGPTTGVYIAGQTPIPVEIQSKQGVTGQVTVSATGTSLNAGSASIQAVIAQQAAELVSSTTGPVTFAEGTSTTFTLSAIDSNGYPTTLPTIPLTILAEDSQGQPATNITINGQAMSQSGIQLSPNTSALTVSDNTSGADAGNYTLVIKDGTGRTWGSFPMVETAGPATKLTLQSQDGEVISTNPNTTLKLQYTDNYGNNAVPSATENVTVTATGGQGGATINGQDATKGVKLAPGADGAITASFAAQPYAGSTWLVTATDGTLTASPVSINVLNTLVTAASVSIKDAKNSSSVQAVAGDGLDITFGAVDSFNNSYTGNDTFTVTFPTNSLSGVIATTKNGTSSVSGTLSQLNTDFANAAVAAAQTLSLQIGDNNVKSARPGSASIVVIPGSFAGFAMFTQQNQLISAQSPITVPGNTPVAVMIRPVDKYGNPVNAAPGSYTVDVSDGGTGGGFRTTPSGQDIGQITFTVGASAEPIYYVNGSGSYDLEAGISTVSAGNSAVSMTSFVPYSSSTSTPGSGTLTVILKDQNGNPATGQAANLKASASGKDVAIGSFAESATSPGTYTATIKSTANDSNVVITVKEGDTTVGQTTAFNS